jgi:uncharacterized protein (TIGR03435 family)
VNKSTHRYRTDSLLLVLAVLALSLPLSAQPKATPAPAHPLRFEVVSIRRNKSNGYSDFRVTPDGFRAINVSLGLSIMKAYIPTNLELSEPIQGEPDWIHQEMYDVEARVAQSDIPEWQNQTRNHQPMLQSMLQAMLAERCNLVVHHVPRQAPGWALVVAKQGPKLQPMKPGETLNGQPLPEEGRLVGHRPGDKPQVSFFGYSMESFAAWLNQSSPRAPVFDKTGLTAKYDFVVIPAVNDSSSSDKNVVVSFDNMNPSNIWDLKALGLKLQPIKIPLETLVIDHIERPTAN